MSMTRGKHVLKKVKVRDTRDDPFVLPLETAIILLKADFASMSPVYGKGDGEGKEPPVASPSMLLKPSSIPTWEQPTSEQMAHNLLLAEMPMSKHPDFDPELKVAKIKVEPHLAHEAYCDLVEGLKVKFGDEGKSELHLGETAWRGGWDGPGYDNCNMGQMPFSKKVQHRVLAEEGRVSGCERHGLTAGMSAPVRAPHRCRHSPRRLGRVPLFVAHQKSLPAALRENGLPVAAQRCALNVGR